jgi:hypothetical protein
MFVQIDLLDSSDILWVGMVYCAVVCKMIHNFVKLERLAVVL